MTTLTHILAAPFGHGATGLDRLISFLTQWNEKRTARRELMKMTDRELNDIGLTRARIDDVI